MHHRLAIPFGLYLLAVGLSGCFGSDATGRYVAKFTNGVYRLQLVQAQDGHLSGQLDTVVLNPQGKPEYSSFVASGVSEGGSISLTFKQSAFISSTLAGSGTISGGRITLTGDVNPGRLSTVVFVKATDAEYQAIVSDMIALANAAAASKMAAANAAAQLGRQRQFTQEAERLFKQMASFDSGADPFLATSQVLEKSYGVVTARLYAYLDRMRAESRNANASEQVNKIRVAMNKAANDVDQSHFQAESRKYEFQANIVPLAKKLPTVLAVCDLKNVTLPAEIQSACSNVEKEAGTFREKYQAIGEAFNKLEQAYQVEHGKQEQLIQATWQIN